MSQHWSTKIPKNSGTIHVCALQVIILLGTKASHMHVAAVTLGMSHVHVAAVALGIYFDSSFTRLFQYDIIPDNGYSRTMMYLATVADHMFD